MSAATLEAAIVAVARGLPPGQVAAIASAVEPQPTPTLTAKAMSASMVKAWSASGRRGDEVALALRAAVAVAEQMRDDQHVEVVWTGPSTTAIPVRATAFVLKDLVDDATSDLLLVSFAAYKVPFLVDALLAASGRGVAIHFVLESTLASADASLAFKALQGAAKFSTWPAEKRPVLPAGVASLHAKCAVADRQVALVTSANLTGHGLTENMELGLLVRGGTLPARIAAHWTALHAAGHLA